MSRTISYRRTVFLPPLQQDSVDKRQHNRYRLAATVNFSWETDDRRVHIGHGVTRDCSISGAFIVTPQKLPIGSILQLDFSLPRLLAAGTGTQLKTRGLVIRTEPDGFAVSANLGPSALRHREKGLSASELQIRTK